MDLGLNFKKLSSILLVFSLAANLGAAVGVYNVKKYGAMADGMTDDAKAFTSAWRRACDDKVRGIVLVPRGVYLVSLAKFEGPCKRPIYFILQGRIMASPGLSMADRESWITFQTINKLTLEGNGVFHGQGDSVWSKNECPNGYNCSLPISLKFNFLNDSIIEGIQSIDSKYFHIHLFGCNNLKMKSINITAPKDSPKTDGIRIENSQNIEISSSMIGTGDDCVSLAQGSKFINIKDVVCGPGHGIMFGVNVRNCTFIETENGVRIKTWPDSSSGSVSNITFDDIVMNNVENPIVIDQQYCSNAACYLEVPSRIEISNVSFTNIRGTSASKVGVSLVCSSSVPCQNVKIGDINLVYNGTDGPGTSSCSNINPILTGKQMPPPCF
ncbi:hypothetical protein UlMin_012169 [Ulmus minor]